MRPAYNRLILSSSILLAACSGDGGGSSDIDPARGAATDPVQESSGSAIDFPLYYELEGSVLTLDAESSRFMLGTTAVDYRHARIDSEDGILEVGARVEVFGAFEAGVLVATEVDVETTLDGEYEILGAISSIAVDQRSFLLGNTETITLSATTRFEDGQRSDLLHGRIVQVTIRESDGLVLEVDFENDRNVQGTGRQLFEVEGTVSQAGNVLTLNGYDFVLTAQTRYDDGLQASGDFNGLAVELDGVVVNGQRLITEIDRQEPGDDDVDIRGPVSVINGEYTLWGYALTFANGVTASDGQWLDLECLVGANTVLTACRADN